MPATLPQIQARLEQAIALRDELAETAQTLAIESASSGVALSEATRQSLQARLNGYQREVELLMKIERDLVANGKAAEKDLRILSGFDASEAISALPSAATGSDASQAPLQTRRRISFWRGMCAAI